MLVGKDGLGRHLRPPQGASQAFWLDDEDEEVDAHDDIAPSLGKIAEFRDATPSIYLCTLRAEHGSNIRFVVFDLNEGQDDGATLVYHRAELESLWSLLREHQDGSMGNLWRGRWVESAQSILTLSEQDFTLNRALVSRLMHETVGFFVGDKAAKLRELGMPPKRGLVLYGPPGNGKTLLTRFCAKAALQSGINVVIVDGQSRSRFDGGSLGEQLESGARHAPAILIIEDIDLQCPRRGDSTADRMLARDSAGLAEVLEFLDGTVETRGYVLLATTNYLNQLDPALARPGRLDEKLYVPPPDLETRVAVLRRLLTRGPVANLDLTTAAIAMAGCSFAELAEAVRRFRIAFVFERGGSVEELFDNAVREVVQEHIENNRPLNSDGTSGD